MPRAGFCYNDRILLLVEDSTNETCTGRVREFFVFCATWKLDFSTDGAKPLTVHSRGERIRENHDSQRAPVGTLFAVVNRPKLKRSEPWAESSSSPSARSTKDGSDPRRHAAEPVEKAISGSAIISDSLSTQAKRRLTIPGTQCVRSPLTATCSTASSASRPRAVEPGCAIAEHAIGPRTAGHDGDNGQDRSG